MQNILKDYVLKYHLIRHKNRMSRLAEKSNGYLLESALRTPLTFSEKQLIKERWKNLIKFIDRGFPEYEMYKSRFGFNIDFVPYCYYLESLIDYFNPAYIKNTVGNKNFSQLLFPNLVKPLSLIKNIDNVFYDDKNSIINISQAIEIITTHEADLIIKPTQHVGAGEGIALLDSFSKTGIKHILENYKKDFIIQKKIHQCETLDKLNSSSINTLRITTLFVGNAVKVLSKTIRVGQAGALTDNVALGGIMIGVDDEGILYNEGYDRNLYPHTSHNGIVFGGMKIPHYNKVVSEVVKAHEAFPFLKIIGWDMALDKDNNPIFIEANVYRPGITVEQFCTGVIFGNDTKDIIKDAIRYYSTHAPVMKIQY